MRFALLTALILASTSAIADDIVGRARVVDGDTLQIGSTRLRLHGVDAPDMR